jgi:putative tricarboxylic transport membrane protein
MGIGLKTVQAALVGAAVMFAGFAQAEFKGLEIIAPGGPGSGQDQAARAMVDAMTADKIATDISVTNIAGGGGMIALSQFLTTKANNGHAILTQGVGHVIFPIVNKTPVSLSDVKPIALIAGEYEIMVVPADSDIKTVADIMAKYKENPATFIWAGGSAGSTENLFYGLLVKAAGLDPRKINFLPHSNTGEVITTVLGKHAQVGGGGYQDFAAQVEAGKLRVIAVAAPERLPGINAPTLKEGGIDIEFANWRGVSGHKSLTDEQTKELTQVFKAMVEGPRWQAILKERGWLNLFKPGAEYEAFLKNEQSRASAMLGELGLIK